VTRTIAFLAALLLARAALASPKLAAIAPDPTGSSVTHASLLGPGGQLYAPVNGSWARATAAGIATPVTNATIAATDVYASGTDAPPFRFRTGVWTASPLPAKGALVLGTGPALAAAVGTAIYVHTDTPTPAWTLAATAPSAPTALWAAGPTQIWIVTGGAAWHLRGKTFTRGPAAGALAGGPRPIAIAATAAIELSANRTVRPDTHGEVVAAAPAGADLALLVKDDHGAFTAERHPAKGAATATAAPAGIAWAWIWADAGAIALAAPTGEVTVLSNGAWHDATVDDVANAAPATHAGPGPAISR
jgi:hypothetical protein